MCRDQTQLNQTKLNQTKPGARKKPPVRGLKFLVKNKRVEIKSGLFGKNHDFADVTLVSKESQKIKAHKLIFNTFIKIKKCGYLV